MQLIVSFWWLAFLSSSLLSTPSASKSSDSSSLKKENNPYIELFPPNASCEINQASRFVDNLSSNPSILFSRSFSTIYFIFILWVKTNDNNNCPFYNHFWPFFRQLYVYLSQKGGSDGHFEVLNGSKYWLVQKLWPQM